mmetsp:Transcript_99665/g.286578  ORF Transcript_99665/g.286578 Transcript_99665/m.286578 type:complete len:203 (+) Transcript_99665:2219-2827(+)
MEAFTLSRMSRLAVKGERPEAMAMMAAVICGMPNKVPRIMARPRSGSRGNRVSTPPTGSIVGGAPSLMASSMTSSAIAASTAETVGGSGAAARNSRGSRPREIDCRAVLAKLQRCISGAGRQGTEANWSRLYNRYTFPSRTRPVRPLRCTALDWQIQTVSKKDMRLLGSYVISLCKPESITTRTSLIVTELSAMFVAKITLT